MEWLKDLLNGHEKKEEESKRKREEERVQQEKREMEMQGQWETIVNNFIRPILEKIESEFRQRNHPCKIKQMLLDNQTGKSHLKEIGLEISNEKKRTSPPYGNLYEIKFSRSYNQNDVMVNFSPSEPRNILKTHSLNIDQISEESIEKEMKEFLSGVFNSKG